MRDRILLCLAHMSGEEMKYVQEAFDTNWVVPLGPNVNAFEKDLEEFVVEAPPAPKWGSHEVTRGDAPKDAQGAPCPPSGGMADAEAPLPPSGGMADAPESKRSALEHPHMGAGGASGAAGTPAVVALSSGTAAVHLALVACGVKAGDEVICQSFTFCASAHPVTYVGAKPVFVDSEADTWNMDPQLLETAIKDRIAKTGRKPKAIIVVYLYGMPAKIDEILEIANRYEIPLIEDAAEGLGSRYRGRVCGTFGKYGVLSFNGNKMITTSGGGALVCPDKEAKQRIMFFATQARESYPYYQHEEIGFNYRMSNICAGIGRGQMTVLNEHIAHHQMLAAFYEKAFAEVPGITFHANPSPIIDSNYWLNTILLDPDLKVKGEEDAYAEVITGAVGGAAGVTHAAKSAHTDCEPNRNVEAMRLWLDKAGIESRPLWKPMHKQPVYRDAPAYVNGVSEALFARGLCLPSGPYVSIEDAQFIVDAIKDGIKR